MTALRFLVDVNVGIRVSGALRDAGHDVVFVGDLDWRLPDADLLSIAHREQRIILTMDRDFGEMVYRNRSPHAGILLIRMPDAGSQDKIDAVLAIIERHGDRLPGRFSVYHRGRLRVR